MIGGLDYTPGKELVVVRPSRLAEDWAWL